MYDVESDKVTNSDCKIRHADIGTYEAIMALIQIDVRSFFTRAANNTRLGHQSLVHSHYRHIIALLATGYNHDVDNAHTHTIYAATRILL